MDVTPQDYKNQVTKANWSWAEEEAGLVDECLIVRTKEYTNVDYLKVLPHHLRDHFQNRFSNVCHQRVLFDGFLGLRGTAFSAAASSSVVWIILAAVP